MTGWSNSLRILVFGAVAFGLVWCGSIISQPAKWIAVVLSLLLAYAAIVFWRHKLFGTSRAVYDPTKWNGKDLIAFAVPAAVAIAMAIIAR